MTASLIGFWILAIVSVASALGVVLHRNPVRAALFLVLNFVVLAVLYIMLDAQVLAAFQVLVYAGAIMVLFLFVIMLLNLGGETTTTDPLVGQRLAGVILGALLLAGLGYAIHTFAKLPSPPASSGALRASAAQAQGINQVQIIGWDLFTRYVYPFELTSILLLVGVVGVIILTKREPIPVSTDANRP